MFSVFDLYWFALIGVLKIHVYFIIWNWYFWKLISWIIMFPSVVSSKQILKFIWFGLNDLLSVFELYWFYFDGCLENSCRFYVWNWYLWKFNEYYPSTFIKEILEFSSLGFNRIFKFRRFDFDNFFKN